MTQQEILDDFHDLYLNTRLNRDLHKLLYNKYSRRDKFFRAAILLVSFSLLGSINYWTTEEGQKIWNVLTLLISILAFMRLVFPLSKRLEEHKVSIYAYSQLFAQSEAIMSNLLVTNLERENLELIKAKISTINNKFINLELNEPKVSKKLIDKVQDKIEQEMQLTHGR